MIPTKTLHRHGITGGIGSGKSTVCRVFEQLGVPVYYADDRAKWLMANTLREPLTALFGEQTWLADGTLDRAYLARQIFGSPELLARMNALVHPAVYKDGDRWHADQMAAGAAYTLKEAALHYESGGYVHMDRMIVVTAPEELRIRRVVARDGVAPEAVRARMEHQLPESEKVARADFIIYNDGEQLLLPQIAQLHRRLMTLAGAA